MTAVHPTALVDPRAELHESVRVGAFSIIGPHVRVGAGCEIGPHCVLEGHTTLAAGPHHDAQLAAMLDQVVSWSGALRSVRAGELAAAA